MSVKTKTTGVETSRVYRYRDKGDEEKWLEWARNAASRKLEGILRPKFAQVIDIKDLKAKKDIVKTLAAYCKDKRKEEVDVLKGDRKWPKGKTPSLDHLEGILEDVAESLMILKTFSKFIMKRNVFF